MADDIAALIAHLGLERADVMGYSLGGDGRAADGDPAPRARPPARRRLGRLPARRVAPRGARGDGPDGTRRRGADAPVAARYQLYARTAPRPEDWPALVAKTADLLQLDYDWTAEVEAMTTPTLLVFADADSIRPAHIVEFYALLGGGLHDAGLGPARGARSRSSRSSPARRTTTSRCHRRLRPP